eukprot:8713878-Pyramimonas_sp.AAC.1
MSASPESACSAANSAVMSRLKSEMLSSEARPSNAPIRAAGSSTGTFPQALNSEEALGLGKSPEARHANKSAQLTNINNCV